MSARSDDKREHRERSAAIDPLLGRVVDGRYTILSLLGKGGMGAVYKAHQASLERAVAIKVLIAAPERARDAEFQRRFFLEAATAARLKHPNTITVFDYGSDDVNGQRIYFIAMELVEGRTLSRAMKNEPFTTLRAVQIALEVCRSLREAHKAGVVHRDLKPGNIMLVAHGDDEPDKDFVKVLDFGLAKPFFDAGAGSDPDLTRAGTFLGSPRYVAPEQIEGKKVDPRADIYSLGCVLYRMLTGHVPFDGEAPLEVMLKHLQDPVPPMNRDDVPPALERIVTDCLAKNPDDRPPGMEELIARLKLVTAQIGGENLPSFISMSGDGHDRVRESQSMPSKDSHSSSVVATTSLPPPSFARPADTHAEPTLPSAPSTSPTLDIGNVPITDHPPTYMLGRRKEPTPKRNVFIIGISFGLLVFLVGLVVLDADVRDRIASALGREMPKEQTPVVDGKPIIEHRARIRVKTTPADANVFEAPSSGLPVLLGTAPLTLDWRMREGEPRTIVIKKHGFADARTEVRIPIGVHQEPVQLEIDVQLTPAR
jgi:serine/threonine protein kinase